MVLLYEDVDERTADLAEDTDDEMWSVLASLAEELHGQWPSDEERRAAIEAQALKMGRILKGIKATRTVLEGHALETKLRIEAIDSRYESLRSWTQNLLTQEGLDKVKDALVTVSLAKTAASWQVDDQEQVPEFYQTAHLKMPLDIVHERGLEQWLDKAEVSKTKVDANFKETGEVPAGMTRVDDKRHLVVR